MYMYVKSCCFQGFFIPVYSLLVSYQQFFFGKEGGGGGVRDGVWGKVRGGGERLGRRCERWWGIK